VKLEKITLLRMRRWKMLRESVDVWCLWYWVKTRRIYAFYFTLSSIEEHFGSYSTQRNSWYINKCSSCLCILRLLPRCEKYYYSQYSPDRI